MSERKNLILVSVRRGGTVLIELTPRLRRLRSQIGRLRRMQTTKARLRELKLELKEEMNKAIEKRLREVTRYSPRTYSEALFKQGPNPGWKGRPIGPSAGLPSLGKRR